MQNAGKILTLPAEMTSFGHWILCVRRTALTEKGSRTLKLESSKSEKESFRAVGGIRADGAKFPL
jgi:hypothetical protein